MSKKSQKPEHAGAKNSGCYWGYRHEAKTVSEKIRRGQSRDLENLSTSEVHPRGKREEIDEPQ